MAHRLASSVRVNLIKTIWSISSQLDEGVDDGHNGPAGRDFGQLSEKFCFGLLGHGTASEAEHGGAAAVALSLSDFCAAEPLHGFTTVRSQQGAWKGLSSGFRHDDDA